MSRAGGQQLGAGELRVHDLHSNSSRSIHPNWKGLQRILLISFPAALAGFQLSLTETLSTCVFTEHRWLLRQK